MDSIRPAAVSGTFYPAEAAVLQSMIKDLLEQADNSGPPPKALIAPHAGYIYSGPVAATGYSRLQQSAGSIHRVVLLGPAHRVPFNGLALSSATHFSTPLGDIPVDRESCQRLLDLPQVQVNDHAHQQEHSLEVHLPFLQTILDEFSLVPIVVGDASPETVSEVIELLWGGPETLLVISSDLSHYHDYATAVDLDRSTTRRIEALALEELEYDQACGRNPIRGLLLYARQHDLKIETLDLRNSGDTAGPRDQVVGYGTYIIPAI